MVISMSADQQISQYLLRDYSRCSCKRDDKLVLLFFNLLLLAGGIVVGVASALHILRFLPAASTPPSQNIPALRLEDSLVVRAPLHHNMSDAELLWLASFAPHREELPMRRVPKVAFLFLTRGPLPLSPLWERFFRGHQGLYSIYIHSNPGSAVDFPRDSVFHDRQIPSQEAKWGEVSLLDAERRLLANALLDFENERFVLVSESCIPLYPFPTVYNYLTLSRHSFVSALDEPGEGGKGKYNDNFQPLITYEQWLRGSQWFELDRKLAMYIVSDTLYYPKFSNFCRDPCYADEQYITNMLTLEFGQSLANRSVTWVDWSRGDIHPTTYQREEINEGLLQDIRQSGSGNCSYNGHRSAICVLFARKFAPKAIEALLQISAIILGF